MAIGRIALCSVKGIIKIVEYEKEVTGNGYIDLTDAVANKLLELKAYGGCEQADTPTPSTPVDIVCNNGALKVKDKELPAGYVRIASIEFAGGTYYDTDEKLYGSDTISMKISGNQATGMNCFGAYTGTGSGNYNYSLYVYFHNSSQCYLRYGDTLYRPVLGTGTKTLTFGPGTTTGFNTNVNVTADTFESIDAAYIGALPNSSSAKFNGTFYGNIEVSDNNGTRLKWIPCKRKSDGVIGYYEVVNGNFLEPVGDTPTAGAEDYSNIEVYVEKERHTIYSNEVLDGYSVVSDTGVIQAASNRCLFGVKIDGGNKGTFKVKAGQTITTKAKISNLGGYLVLYNSETINSTTYIKKLAFSAAELVEGYYTRTVVSDTDGYAVFQGTATYSEMQANDRKVNIPCVEKVGYSGGATATCEDLLGVGDYKDEQEILSGDVVIKCGVVVLTGNEDRTTIDQYNRVSIIINKIVAPTSPRVIPALCTHFENLHNSESIGDITAGQFYTAAPKRIYFHISQSTTEAWKQYLADQLSAGTPVIVVYPLATPTTLSVAGQSLSIPAGDSRIEIVEGSILNLPLYAKYKSTTE